MMGSGRKRREESGLKRRGKDIKPTEKLREGVANLLKRNRG